MGLLDLVVHYKSPDSAHHSSTSTSNKYSKFASEVAHKALNLMILVRPVTMVATLAKEVAMFLASQHITHAPHSSLQPLQVSCFRKKMLKLSVRVDLQSHFNGELKTMWLL